MRPIPNSIAAMADDLVEWRRDIHAHPELGFEEVRTSGIVAEKLRAFGFDAVETGIAGTGVVGVLKGQGDGPAIMLRADMDALPIKELSGVPHASTNPGKMHACGHDGHTTMLLGAARHLAETRNFKGTAYFCFQPAEEGGGGAKVMVDEGLFERFPVSAVYGLHNWPGIPIGEMSVKEGPVLAAADEFNITVTGQGGHAAEPHKTRDPLLAGAQLVTALQSVVSRVIDPLEPAVLSVTKFQSGTTHNVIPDQAEICGTTRSYDSNVQATMHGEIERLSAEVARAFGCEACVRFGKVPYPATINDAETARFAHSVMADLLGEDAAHFGHPPTMAGEDFAFMAQEVPGAFAIIGNGDTAPVHHPEYDFNDAAAPIGVAYWVRLVEMALPLP